MNEILENKNNILKKSPSGGAVVLVVDILIRFFNRCPTSSRHLPRRPSSLLSTIAVVTMPVVPSLSQCDPDTIKELNSNTSTGKLVLNY